MARDSLAQHRVRKHRVPSAFRQICTFLAFAGCLAGAFGALAQNQALDTIIATVNSEAVTESQIRFQIALARYEALRAGQELPSPRRQREISLDAIIDLRVQTQFAERRGITVPQDSVERAIESIAQANNVTVGQMQDDLEQSDIEFDFFRGVVRDRLIVSRLVDEFLAPTIVVEDGEIDGYLKKFGDELAPVDEFDVSVIVFHIPQGVTADERRELGGIVNSVVNDIYRGEDFSQLQQTLSRYEGVEVGNLGWNRLNTLNPVVAEAVSRLKVGEAVGPVDAGSAFLIARLNDVRRTGGFDAPPRRMYQLRQIVIGTRGGLSQDEAAERLNGLREQIIQGQDFAEIARIHTENADNRESGGELGWLSEAELPSAFTAVFENLNVGDVSPVLHFADRQFLFQLLGRRMSNFKENQREYVRGQLRNRQLDQAHSDWVVNLRDEASIEMRTVL